MNPLKSRENLSSQGLGRRKFLAGAAVAAGALVAGRQFGNSTGNATATEVRRDDLKPLGGHWFVTIKEPHVYYYEDSDRFVDLFSHHVKDTNKDGILDVRLSHNDRFLIMDSQGYPNHPTAIFPNNSNPNRILVQKFKFKLPLRPQMAESITRLPMGPVGVALNGVVFFNPFEAGGINAIEGYSEVWLDSCCGHPQQHGVYHYHKYPSCVKSPFRDDGKQHSPVIGFAFDGFPLYGPYESDGTMARDLKGESALDVCNGHRDGKRGYHYHVTPGRFPYITGGYAGIPEPSNNSRELYRHKSGAIQNNASGTSLLGGAIESVLPGSVPKGGEQTVRIRLSREAGRRFFVPREAPTWVQIGPHTAETVTRKGDLIEAVFKIPQDATAGVPLDCHMEFENSGGRGLPIVVKKNDVIRVM